jgi:hypothetical protein
MIALKSTSSDSDSLMLMPACVFATSIRECTNSCSDGCEAIDPLCGKGCEPYGEITETLQCQTRNIRRCERTNQPQICNYQSSGAVNCPGPPPQPPNCVNLCRDDGVFSAESCLATKIRPCKPIEAKPLKKPLKREKAHPY